MSDKAGLHPEEEFDHVEDTGVLPHRTAQHADLELLREAIREQGKMMGEVNEKLLSQAEELLRLHERCRRNAHNIKVLAKRLGLRAEGDSDKGPTLTSVQQEDSPETTKKTT